MAWRPWFQTAHVVKGQMKSKMKAIERWDIVRGDWVNGNDCTCVYTRIKIHVTTGAGDGW